MGKEEKKSEVLNSTLLQAESHLAFPGCPSLPTKLVQKIMAWDSTLHIYHYRASLASQPTYFFRRAPAKKISGLARETINTEL